MTDLIYRRLVLITGAHANLCALARGWEVVIRGWVGHNHLSVGEYYNQPQQARQRRGQVNHEGRALVVSIEEILYPLSMIVIKHSTQLGISQPPVHILPLPSTPPTNRLLDPFTSVESVYGKESR